MKLIRALGITMELLSKRRVTAAELAERFEVSTRTIYRDIELINQAGIPITSYTGTVGGFEVMEGFYLTKQHFSLDDLSVIYNLLKGMEGAIGAKTASILGKLSSLQPALLQARNAAKIIFEMSASGSEKDLVQVLLQAIEDKRVVSFFYTSSMGSHSERSVEPGELLWSHGKWYLKGYCLLRQDNRMFRLSRLSSLKITEHPFRQREDVPESDPDSTRESDSESDLESDSVEVNHGMQAHLRFDLAARHRVMEQFGEACVCTQDHIDVHTVFYQPSYAVSVVLSYGAEVTVISPEELKQSVLQTIAEIQQRYVQRESQPDLRN
ncbi:helix-turn-helix transcriptional regulator [Paenibacillus senegalensis]|uniref:helix-turn-helix transcriptional regulator n=1 Tax=Paenibacillus senegalensis TaxID=1465766 RepID=UPI0002888E59|nr:YafY family protein [Paenibacillus senegalensis]